MATDNSRLDEKLTIRRMVLDDIKDEEINVLELYAGKSVMWGILKDEYSGKKRINLLSIEKEKGKNPRALCGDNMKFLDALNLDNFDIIDVDAYGIPARQLEKMRRKRYKGTVIVTAIQSMYGNLPYEVVNACGVSNEMYQAIRSLFAGDGLEYIKGWLYTLGFWEITGFFNDRKYYFFGRMRYE